MNRRQAKRWMIEHAADFDTATELAEAAAHVQIDGQDIDYALDDPIHWIWELAIEIKPCDL